MTAPIFFIVDSAAGDGPAADLWPQICATMRRASLGYEFELTRGPLTATSFVRQALRAGSEVIVAVGGDGTVSEAANGFFLADGPVAPGASLAVVPSGRRSDFAHGLGIPSGLAALPVLLGGRKIEIDVGRVSFTDDAGNPTARYFLNAGEVGLGARIVVGARRFTRVGSRAAFIASTMSALTDPEPWEATLLLEGGQREEVRALGLLVALGPYTGGGIPAAPDAKMDDGLFDVVVMGTMAAPELLLDAARMCAGAAISHRDVRHVRARDLEVETSSSPPIVLDGEAAGVGPARFRIFPAAINVHVPAP